MSTSHRANYKFNSENVHTMFKAKFLQWLKSRMDTHSHLMNHVMGEKL